MQSPLILSIETATRSGSVCLTEGRRILSAVSLEAQASHSTHLLQAIHDVLEIAGRTLEETELFAAANGPGSFTGLRIGLATVKSFAATFDRVCVGIPTLQAVAHAAKPSENTVALLPAGRGELFAQLFSVGSNGRALAIDCAAHLKPNEVWERYAGVRTLKWAGEGARAHATALQQQALANGIQFFDESIAPDLGEQAEGWTVARAPENLAASVATLALGEFQKGNGVRAEDLSANYVRPSDAEIN